MNGQFIDIWLAAGFAAALFVTIIWIISLIKRDASIMDIYWGIGFILVTLVYYTMTDGYSIRKSLVAILVLIWGVRLSLHIGLRNAGKPEDPRYRAWRTAGGTNWWWRSYFKVFLLQGAILWIVSLPLLTSQYYTFPVHLTLLDWIGIGLWTFGFLFESIADRQLSVFKKDPANKGKVYSAGLWKFTRHPNYFGEAVIWWGFFMFAASAGGYFTVVSPLLMTFLLLKVSGVAMLDQLLADTKPEYTEYIKRTNAFFPGLPKQG
ncbi:DUF1295 domain-containing protein [candidate division KSB1 bacterium]